MKKPLLALVPLFLLTVGCVDSDKSKGTPAGAVDAAAVAVGDGSAIDASVTQNGRPVPTQASVCGDEQGDAGCPGLDEPVDTFALAKLMGFGANIGNTLENTYIWETGWGQPRITQDYINGMASQGVKTVRVPVAWNTYALNGVVDPSKMARVREVVEWILAAGMVAIVNIHWDGGWLFNEQDILVDNGDGTKKKVPNPNKYRLTADVKDKFANYWDQIGKAFGDLGHALIFEGLNEEAQYYVNGAPNGAPDIAALNEINQLFVNVVRAQGGYNFTRPLLIVGFGTDFNKTCVDAFVVPTDPAGPNRQFLSLHFYEPSSFTILEETATWGTPTATWGTDREKQALENQFTKVANFVAKKQIPVIIGEFGVTLGLGKNPGNVKRDPASRTLWMKSVIKACFSRGMVPVLWDCGSDISRKDGAFSTELKAALSDTP
jgi:endoglucanase